MQGVPLFTFRTDGEWLTTTKLNPLIIPNLGEVVPKDGEIIICHLPLLVAEL